jgi:hypothetical protein
MPVRRVAFHVRAGLVVLEREWPSDAIQDVEVPAHGEVDVAVEEAREHRLPGHIDRVIGVQARTNVEDATSLDHDVGSTGRSAGAIDDHASSQDSPCHLASRARGERWSSPIRIRSGNLKAWRNQSTASRPSGQTRTRAGCGGIERACFMPDSW